MSIKTETEEDKMSEKGSTTPSNLPALAGGLILILLGLLFLIGQFFRIDLAGFLWPFFILVPGVLVFLYALSLSDATGEGLAVFGSLVSVTGLLLLFQNTTGLWASWAYAWSLVIPTSIGLGQWIFGARKGRPDIARIGARLMWVGLAIFLAGFIFFELIIGISGLSLGQWVWPLVLIILGIAILARTFWPRKVI